MAVFLAVVIILINNNSGKNKRIRQHERSGFNIQLLDSASSVSIEYDLAKPLKDSTFRINLLSQPFLVKYKSNQMPEFKISFDTKIYPVVNSETVIAWWTGQHWQELKTVESNSQLTTVSHRTGIYALKKKPNLGILLVHGLGGDNTSWYELLELTSDKPLFHYLGNYNFDNDNGIIFEQAPALLTGQEFIPQYTINFSDNQNLTFNEQGEEIRVAITKILSTNTCNKIILVGHSMGGIACRAYLNNFGTKNIAGYISVTAPHMGSFLASIKRWANDNEYSDGFIGDLSYGMKYALVKGIDIFYPRISINAKALEYLEPGSSQLNEIHSKSYPDYLPTATVTSIWEADITNSTFIRNALTNIAEAFEQKYNPVYTDAQLIKYDIKTRKAQTDGVVCYQSQILESSIPNGESINPYHFTTNVFHTKTSKEDVICSAIDSLLLHYSPECLTRVLTEL